MHIIYIIYIDIYIYIQTSHSFVTVVSFLPGPALGFSKRKRLDTGVEQLQSGVFVEGHVRIGTAAAPSSSAPSSASKDTAPSSSSAPSSASKDTAASSSSAPSSGPKETSPQKEESSTNAQEGTEDSGKDLVELFLPDEGQMTCVKDPKQKDQFMGCSFVMPGIALKKNSMALSVEGSDIPSYVAVLGTHKVKMYKTSKPSVSGMVMGDMMKDPKVFWKTVSDHLREKQIAAIFVFDTLRTGIAEAGPHQKDVTD